MPRIPLPSVQQESNRSTQFGAPGVAPPADFSGLQTQRLGEAVHGLGVGAMRIGNAVQDEVDTAQIKRADNLLADADRKVLAAYRSKIGKDAIDSRQATIDALEQNRKSILPMLGNDRQRRLWGQAAGVRRQDVLSAIDSHHTSQALAYNIGESKEAMDSAVIDWINFGLGDPTRGSVYQATAYKRAHEFAETKGYGPEQTKALLREVATQGHGGIVEELVRQQRTEDARKYLQAAGGEMDPAKRTDLEALVQGAGDDDAGTQAGLDAIQFADTSAGAEKLTITDYLAGKRPEPSTAMPEDLLKNATFYINNRYKTSGEGHLSARARRVALSVIANESHNRVVGRAQQAAAFRERAVAWANTHPSDSIEQMPADIKKGLADLGMEGTLSSIDVRAKRAKAVLLSQQISSARRAMRDLDADPEAYALQRAANAVKQFPRDADFKRKFEELGGAARLKEVTGRRESLQRNIESMSKTLDSLRGSVLLLSGEQEQPLDAFDALLQELDGATPEGG